jgi:hypothetical protein
MNEFLLLRLTLSYDAIIHVYVYNDEESARKRTTVMIPEDLKIRASKYILKIYKFVV